MTASVIDCAENPFDLRPAADAIMERLRKALATQDGDKPIVVLMSENHRIPTHKMLQQICMSRFLDIDPQYKAAQGFEYPHNHLEKIIEDGARLRIPKTLKGQISDADANGSKALKAMLAHITFTQAAASQDNFLEFCLQNNVSTHFNDLADAPYVPGRPMLDEDDPFTASIIAQHAAHLQGMVIRCDRPEGMMLRNHAIVQNAMTHARESGAQIYLMPCGYDHMLGNTYSEPYETSLYALFTGAGATVIPVFVNGAEAQYDRISAAGRAVPETILVDGLDAEQFMYMFDAGGMRADEEAVLRKIRSESGGEIDLFESLPQKKKRKREVKRAAQAWIAQAPRPERDGAWGGLKSTLKSWRSAFTHS